MCSILYFEHPFHVNVRSRDLIQYPNPGSPRGKNLGSGTFSQEYHMSSGENWLCAHMLLKTYVEGEDRRTSTAPLSLLGTPCKIRNARPLPEMKNFEPASSNWSKRWVLQATERPCAPAQVRAYIATFCPPQFLGKLPKAVLPSS